MSCDTCYFDFVSNCQTEIRVYAQLQPASTYQWVITDKFSRKYSGSAVTDADGFFTIPIEELPAGLLTQYSGEFTMEVMDAGCKPVKFKMAGEYDCIRFHVKAGTYEKETLGCDFDCTGISGAVSALIPFTDAETVTIDWSNYSGTYGNNPSVQVYHEFYPGVFSLVNVSIQQIRVDELLTEITVNNGGAQTGYIIIS